MKHLFAGLTLAAALTGTAAAQSVTVGSAGSGADYATLTAAVVGLQATSTDGTPNTITFLDEGPFYEFNRIVINPQRTGTDDLTIEGAPGVRPIIIADLEAWAQTQKTQMIYVRKRGNLTIKDLIIIPPSEGVVDEASYLAKVGEIGMEIYTDEVGGTSITLQNILVSSNNGSDRPVASLDGLTPPVITPETISFRDEGIYLPTLSGPFLAPPHYVYFEDVVVSGLNGDQGSEGIRGFPDGPVGSKWIIGPGTTVSYNKLEESTMVTSATNHGGFQPGGAIGFDIQVVGTQEKPVKILNNNSNGITVTNQAGADQGLTRVEWAIIANNKGAGIKVIDQDTSLDLSNVTIANNEGGIFWGPNIQHSLNYEFSNVIATGTGDTASPSAIIDMVPYAAGSTGSSALTIANSAIVLNGPYSANTTMYGGDAIIVGDNVTLTTTSNLSADPQFASLDATSPNIAVVSNAAYGTAGPGGVPLVGGATYNTSSVSDWQIF